MFKRSAFPSLMLVVGLAGPLAAQSGTGTFSTIPMASDTIAMPDGAAHIMNHYQQITLANSATYPIHNTKLDCVAMFRIVGDMPQAGSGSCFGQSLDGHGYTMWWQMTEVATSACPDACGTWGVYGGYGRFAGMTGGGNWKRNGQFMDGSSSGTWTGTLTKK
ncbi:MAG: hypothetical protein OER90_01720 [Gemmatimonadota bacterium]|nr:hypothetical protein [Gemmatimonadota bacterium]